MSRQYWAGAEEGALLTVVGVGGRRSGAAGASVGLSTLGLLW